MGGGKSPKQIGIGEGRKKDGQGDENEKKEKEILFAQRTQIRYDGIVSRGLPDIRH